MLKRSSRCQPIPPTVGAPPDPDTVSELEATTEAESSNWDSFTTLVHTAAQAMPMKCTSTVATQTDDEALDGGPLWLLLSATDGHNGSTQVTHTEQVDKVPSTASSTALSTGREWRRRCGFLGLQSLRDSEQALQDLCGVTMTVFSLILCLTPATRYRSSDIPAEDKLVLFLMKLK
ncbi:unnamed protein product [Ixodes persulcatus]